MPSNHDRRATKEDFTMRKYYRQGNAAQKPLAKLQFITQRQQAGA
jgi:hypothetical protein